MPFKKINIEGQRYGYLTVIKRTNKLSKHGQAYFMCLCDCGKEKEICMGGLRKGDTVIGTSYRYK